MHLRIRIALCALRTHIDAEREMIVADYLDQCLAALDKLAIMQKDDFVRSLT